MVSFKRFAQCNCRALIKAIDAYVEKADKGIEQALEAGGYAQPKETTQRIKALEEELTEALKNEFTLTVSSLNDCEDLREFYNQAWPERRDSNEIVERLSRTFESTFEEVIPDFTAEYIKRVEADAATSTVSLLKETVSWIRSWSARLAELMKLTDNKTIQGILDKGLREGRSVQQVSEDIHSSGLREYGYRARRVATTELLRAHSVAQQESFMQSPVVTSKMWKHSGWRTYARKNHMKSAESGGVNGQIVQKDQTFTLTGANGTIYYPMYPRDSSLPPGESINCGCVCQPVVDESILGMSLEERNRLRDEAIKELNEDFDKKLDDQNSAQAFARRDPEEWKRERARSRPEQLSRSYVNHSDKLYANLQNVKEQEGYEDFAVHGIPEESAIEYETTNGVRTKYSAKEMADILSSDPAYHGGKIRLLSCGAGSKESGFAQELADEMGVEVLAPTEKLWVTDKGDMFISDSDELAELWYNNGDIDNSFRSTGEWRSFFPGKGNEI